MAAFVSSPATTPSANSISSFTIGPFTATAGQPVIVGVASSGGSGFGTPAISDNFAVSYSWTQIVRLNNNSQQYLTYYVGTGGSGGSGTVTVTGITNSASYYFGGHALPLNNVPPGSGLVVIDQSGTAGGSLNNTNAITFPSLTPTSSNDLAIYCVLLNAGLIPNANTPAGFSYLSAVVYPPVPDNLVTAFVQQGPQSGVALAPTTTQSSGGTNYWGTVGILVFGLPDGSVDLAESSSLPSSQLPPIGPPPLTAMLFAPSQVQDFYNTAPKNQPTTQSSADLSSLVGIPSEMLKLDGMKPTNIGESRMYQILPAIPK